MQVSVQEALQVFQGSRKGGLARFQRRLWVCHLSSSFWGKMLRGFGSEQAPKKPNHLCNLASHIDAQDGPHNEADSILMCV